MKVKTRDKKQIFIVWNSKGVFTIEAAMLTGLLMLIIMVLTLSLFKTVYKSGLEALFNYADNNFVFQTEAYNMRKGPESLRLQGQLKLKEGLVTRAGESRRRIMNLAFTNNIERSHVGRRLILGQVMVEFAEQSKKPTNKTK